MAKKNATPPPSKGKIKEPTKKDAPVNNAAFQGHRSANGTTHLLHSDDKTTPGIIAKTSGNIYLTSKRTQNVSETLLHKVTGKVDQFYGPTTKTIKGPETVIIDGANSITVNSSRTVGIAGGDHTLNVSGTIKTIAGSDHNIEVAGNQNLTIQTNQVKKVSGTVKETIGSDETKTIGGKTNLTCVGDFVNSILGKVTKVKASSETGVTLSEKAIIAISDEASLNVGASEKVQVGAFLEQTIAKKHTISVGPFTEINVGPRKIKDATTQITDHQIKTNKAVAMWKMKAPMSGIGFKVAKVAATLWVWK